MAVLTAADILALFAQEAAVRLASLDQLLLQLERAPADDVLIRSIFREIHTIKGSSAIAGLDDVSRLAHDLEEQVEALRNGRTAVTPDVMDTLFAGADRLSSIITSPASVGRPIAAPGVGEPGHAAVQIPNPPDAAILSATRAQPAPVERPDLGPGRSGQAAAGPPAGSAPPAGAGVVMVPMERLDELVELLGEAAAAHLRVGRMLKDRFGVDPASSSEFNELSRSLNVLQDRVMRTRMVPVATITAGLHRAVRDIARAQGKDVRWEVEGVDTELDRAVLHQLSDSLLHLVRNAVDHGIEEPGERGSKNPQGSIVLHARQLGSEVIIAVTDDGRGIDLHRVRERAARLGIDTTDLSDDETLQLIFRPGLSTTTFVTEVSGRGVGLDVVHTNVEAARGRIEVRSQFGSGAEFRIVVPITLAVLRCLVVETAGQRFALPFHRVIVTQAHETAREIQAEGRKVVWVDDQPVTVSTLARTLGLAENGSGLGPIVVLTDSSRLHAFQVDRLVGQRDVALKGLSRLLPHLPAVAGASIEPDGSIFAVLDPPGLIQRARHHRRAFVPPVPGDASGRPARRILVVDDALTVRELQRSILQRAGFEVRLAGDGLQALAKLLEEPADLVLTDIEMPNMDGFALTEAIRAAPALANIPVLILSSRSSDADRERGLHAGADGYILKSGFDESALLAAVNRLRVGRDMSEAYRGNGQHEVSHPNLEALLVQESSPQRRQLIDVLQRDGDITVVGPAVTAGDAIHQVRLAHPDVIVLDLQLADGGSLHAIEQIMAGNPTPILVLSARIEDRNSPSAVEALLAGALDALPVPAQWTDSTGAGLRHNVRQLSKVVVIRHPRGRLTRTPAQQPVRGSHRPVVAVGASTGGPSALACLLSGLGGLRAPVLVVQHLHSEFTDGLLTWMARVSALPVEMARHHHVPEPGHVYLAPGELHLRLGPNFALELSPLPATLHRPSANQLFHSVAENAGPAGVGVLLTGMGDDGALGLLAIRTKGGRTLAQDEATSAVFGMPRAAQRLGAVDDLLPLDRIAAAVTRAVTEIRG